MCTVAVRCVSKRLARPRCVPLPPRGSGGASKPVGVSSAPGCLHASAQRGTGRRTGCLMACLMGQAPPWLATLPCLAWKALPMKYVWDDSMPRNPHDPMLQARLERCPLAPALGTGCTEAFPARHLPILPDGSLASAPGPAGGAAARATARPARRPGRPPPARPPAAAARAPAAPARAAPPPRQLRVLFSMTARRHAADAPRAASARVALYSMTAWRHGGVHQTRTRGAEHGSMAARAQVGPRRLGRALHAAQ